MGWIGGIGVGPVATEEAVREVERGFDVARGGGGPEVYGLQFRLDRRVVV